MAYIKFGCSSYAVHKMLLLNPISQTIKMHACSFKHTCCLNSLNTTLILVMLEKIPSLWTTHDLTFYYIFYTNWHFLFFFSEKYLSFKIINTYLSQICTSYWFILGIICPTQTGCSSPIEISRGKKTRLFLHFETNMFS